MMSNPSYDLADQACTRAGADLLVAIGEQVEGGGLRNGSQLRAGTNETYVSAEFLPVGQDERSDGDILTWVTDDVSTGSFSAVDVNAREFSTWPPADVDVTAPGARESRACANVSLGKTQGQVECEDNQLNGQAPIDLDCSDL